MSRDPRGEFPEGLLVKVITAQDTRERAETLNEAIAGLIALQALLFAPLIQNV
jgi:hypothetical protein